MLPHEKKRRKIADRTANLRNKRRLIIDVDSTEDAVHGNQEVQPLTVTHSDGTRRVAITLQPIRRGFSADPLLPNPIRLSLSTEGMTKGVDQLGEVV